MYIFKIDLVINENVRFAFLYVLKNRVICKKVLSKRWRKDSRLSLSRKRVISIWTV